MRHSSSRAKTFAGIALLLLAVPFVNPGTLRAQVGILAGFQRTSLWDFLPENGFVPTDTSDGFHVGLFLRFKLGVVGIRPAVVYHRMPNFVSGEGPFSDSFDLEMVEVPIDLMLQVPAGPLRPYLLAGPTLAFPSSERITVDRDLADRVMGIEVGGGVELDIGFRTWLELRYGFGLQDLSKHGIDLGLGPADLFEPRLKKYTLRLGIGL